MQVSVSVYAYVYVCLAQWQYGTLLGKNIKAGFMILVLVTTWFKQFT